MAIRSNKKGFTYIELMMGMAILLLGMVIFSGLYRYYNVNKVAAREKTSMATVAKNMAEVYKSTPYNASNTQAIDDAIAEGHSQGYPSVNCSVSPVSNGTTTVTITISSPTYPVNHRLHINDYVLTFYMVDKSKLADGTTPPSPTPTPPPSVEFQNQNVVTCSNVLNIDGGAQLYAPNSTVFISAHSGSGLNYGGGIRVIASKIYSKQSVTLSGSAILGQSNSTTYIDGDINLSGGSNINGILNYTGTVNKPGWFILNATSNKVSSINFPALYVPTPKADSWYTTNGYTSVSTPSNNMKYIGNTYSFPTYNTYSNVTIYSKGDINLSGAVIVKGILYAPSGTVNITGGAKFYGVIVADSINMSGGVYVEFQDYLNNLPF